MKLQKNIKKYYTFHIAAAQHLQKKLPLDCQNLKDLLALHPQSRQAKSTLKAFTQLAKQLPRVIKEDEIACIHGVWKALQSKPIPSNWYETGKLLFVFLSFLFFNINYLI